MKKRLLVVAMLAGFSSAALADDTGMYVYGSVGQANVSFAQAQADAALTSLGATGSSTVSNNHPTAYSLHLGYQFTPYWAIEGGYGWGNDPSYAYTGTIAATPFTMTVTGKSEMWNLSAAGTLPFGGGFAGTARLGIATVHDSLTATASTAAATGSAGSGGTKTDLTYGLGVKYDFSNNVSIRADINSYNSPTQGVGRFNIWTIGLGYMF